MYSRVDTPLDDVVREACGAPDATTCLPSCSETVVNEYHTHSIAVFVLEFLSEPINMKYFRREDRKQESVVKRDVADFSVKGAHSSGHKGAPAAYVYTSASTFKETTAPTRVFFISNRFHR